MRPIGYQLYSSRRFRPVWDTLRMVSEAGYSHVEPHAQMFRDRPDVTELSEFLRKYRLEMTSAHFDLSLIQNDSAYVIGVCRQLGIQTVVVPFIEPEIQPKSKEDWGDFGKTLSEAMQPVRDAGLTTAYHNHEYELERLPDGQRPIDVLLNADPDMLLEIDLAWGFRAGLDPEDFLEEYSERILIALIKDIAEPGTKLNEGGWADIGHGVLDWNRLWNVLNGLSIRNRIVEHGNPADHWRFAGRSIAALRRIERAHWL